MPWLLRFAIGSLLIFLIGAAIIVWACVSTGWETLGRFAYGSLTAGAGLIGSPLLFDERCDSPAMAQIFPRALERLGFVVSFAARFCEVCLMKHRRFLLERPRCSYRV